MAFVFNQANCAIPGVLETLCPVVQSHKWWSGHPKFNSTFKRWSGHPKFNPTFKWWSGCPRINPTFKWKQASRAQQEGIRCHGHRQCTLQHSLSMCNR
ncbi:hypothetical protein BGZ73_007674 [Actinomortierella ambigua]|nr:hypothetical protein BGZ73_007674 [Actinomortierella ambigua]